MVIRSKYGLNVNKWDSGLALRTTFHSPWKFMSSQYSEFIKLLSFKVGNGGNIRFLEYTLGARMNFQHGFQLCTDYRLYTMSLILEFWVDQAEDDSNNFGGNFHFLRDFNDNK